MNSEFMLIRLDFTFDFSGPQSHGAVTLCEKPDFTFNISSISRSRLCGAKNISLFLMRWVANGWVLTFPQSREVGNGVAAGRQSSGDISTDTQRATAVN